MATLQNGLDFARSPADKTLFRKHVQSELDKIREEVEETCAVAGDVYPVSKSAYNETLSLLEQMPRDIPMPDMMWLEDGGIGLEWRPGEGIATMISTVMVLSSTVFFLVKIGRSQEFVLWLTLPSYKVLLQC